MDKEQQLEALTEKIEKAEDPIALPLFEIFITLFSVTVSILLFLEPNMIQGGADSGNIYENLSRIMPQPFWAFWFFIGGITKTLGLLLNNLTLRLVGLVVSAALYGIMTVCYVMDFPNFSTILFAWMTVFVFIAMSLAKHSGLDLERRIKR